MASSGWQGEQTIWYYGGSPWVAADLNVSSISHSGTNLSVSGTIKIRVSAGSVFYNGISLSASGGFSTSINLNGYAPSTQSESAFSVTIGGVSEAVTTYQFSVSLNSSIGNGTVYWTLYFDPAGTAPTDLTATLVNFGPDWARIAVSISSYGTPSTSANRYIEAGVCQGPNYGGPYKYNTAQAVTSNTFTISNTSPGGTMTIAPNTSYIYGGYATNNTVDVATVGGTFVTLPSAPVLSAIDMGGGQIEVDVTHAAEGSAYQVTEEYSVDGGTTWNQILNNKFSLLLNAQTVVTVRRVSTAGASTNTITITPQFTTAIYASVINQTKKVKHIYASVNGQTKKVEKVYVSVNGLTKKVFEDI